MLIFKWNKKLSAFQAGYNRSRVALQAEGCVVVRAALERHQVYLVKISRTRCSESSGFCSGSSMASSIRQVSIKR